MSTTDLELLARYARHRSEEDFAEVVRRHLDLVYSAALRQVRSPQLAEEVAQSTFLKLAGHADRLASDTILAAWLYQVARRESIDVVRREARRQLREQIATELSAMNTPDVDWRGIEPMLDEAMEALEEPDRAAILLRYFENKSLREVGAALGTSDDAARKRVNRAVEALREHLLKRGVAVGSAGLVVSLSAHAVHGAPAGLAAAISASAAAGATTLAAVAATATTAATATATTALETIAMTAMQKTIMTAALVAAVGVAIYEARLVSNLREQNRALQEAHTPVAGQLEELKRENDRSKQRIAALSEELASAKKSPSEVQKLRGQVGALRQEKAEISSKSALSKVTADPATRKAMREQQKMAMGAVYGGLSKRLKLTPELTGQLNDLLADDVMENIEVITQALHDRKTTAEIDALFTRQEAAMGEKVAALLGPEGLAEYQQYSKSLLPELVSKQFDASISGGGEPNPKRSSQLSHLITEELQAALGAAGLPADFQAVPMLNFRNIASPEFSEQSLRLLDSVLERVGTRASDLLNAEELKKWREFTKTAVESNRTILLMNRSMMAPIGG